jgi:hypothetical protein
MIPAVRAAGIVPLLALSVAACGAGDDDAAGAGEASAVGQGLSPEQIESRVEPMSPEAAESLGIIDSTIHIANPAGPDTMPPPDSIPPPAATER